MKVALFGASGGSGKYVLQELLKQDFDINALVRNPSSLQEFSSSKLNLIQGDVLNSSDLEKVITNCDAVVYLIGHRKDSIPDLQEKSIQMIIDSMQKFGIKRLIALTGAGVYLPEDKPNLIDKLTTWIIKTFDPNRFYDGENMVKIIMSSNLNWTIVRTQLQQNKMGSGDEHIGPLGSGHTWKCSRGFIARFIVSSLKNNDYIKEFPVISDNTI